MDTQNKLNPAPAGTLATPGSSTVDEIEKIMSEIEQLQSGMNEAAQPAPAKVAEAKPKTAKLSLVEPSFDELEEEILKEFAGESDGGPGLEETMSQIKPESHSGSDANGGSRGILDEPAEEPTAPSTDISAEVSQSTGESSGSSAGSKIDEPDLHELSQLVDKELSDKKKTGETPEEIHDELQTLVNATHHETLKKSKLSETDQNEKELSEVLDDLDSENFEDEDSTTAASANATEIGPEIGMTIKGNMGVRLNYGSGNEYINLNFNSKSIIIALADGTEIKLPIRKKRR